ncbi:hypothetical protein HK099_005312 [Clydaea vesicula]|uniref:Exocyst complex component Sec8 n=1 Tax=Clydaea vesicula TaxID=447962 RepID=A0AAD5U1T7_9FUNG|nr:hypothetical protein HK099_005312 [Clydaea vesicula]
MSKPPNPNQATAKVEKAEVVKQLPTEISDVMNEIQTFWNFMTPETFNPVPHSLTLLDSSSLGRDYKSFLKIYEKLEIAMDIIVNDYHQGFNNAIQKFSGVVENIADSKTRVLRMQSDLENCKDWLQNKRFDLFHLWIKSLQYSEMIRILDLVEGLMDVKKKLKYLKQEKFVLSACKLLLSSIKALNSVECQSIVALENIREKLKEYKKTLPELLLDELQNHLYLKSPYSLYRLENDANYEPESRVDKNIEKTFAESASIKAFRAQIAKTTKFFDDKEILEEDFDRNPEADSYTYMHSIVLGMHLLGNLPKSLKTLNERLSLELHYVIEKTIQEVDLRNEKILMTLKDSRAVDSKTNVTSNLVANNVNNLTLKTSDYKPDLIGIEKKIEHSKVFRDLLNSLYRKFEVIVQGHFFVLHVAHSIAELDQVEGVYTIRDVWFTVQNEVKRLLYDYIANVDQKKIANAVISMDEVMKKKIQDQTSKQLYRIMNGNFNLKIHDLYKNISGNEVYGNAEDLQTGRDSVTNDILKRMKEGGGTDKVANSGIIDKFETSKTVGRKLLLSSDPYNILIAFEPTCEFMENVEETIGVRFPILLSERK